MAEIFTKKVLILLSLCALVVLAFAFLMPVDENQESEVIQETELQQVQGEDFSISNFFNTKATPGPINTRELPPDIKPDEACRVEDYIVKEGTVASNTICINETPTPTFTVTPTPTITQ